MNATTSITLALATIIALAIIGFDSDNHLAFAKNGTACGTIDCQPPTLGVTQDTFQRVVSNGFGCQGQFTNAESFYTPFPLIKAKVGEPLTCTVTIYENEGTANIRHVALAFGIAEGTRFGDSNTQVVIDIDHQGNSFVTKVDPTNSIGSFDVSTVTRKDFVYTGNNVLEVTFKVTFDKPLDFNIVSVRTWDFFRNTWEYYFNHGVNVYDPTQPVIVKVAKQVIDPEEQHFLAQKKATESYLAQNPQYQRHTNPHDRDSVVFDDRLVQEQIKAEQTLAKMFVSAS